MVWNDVSAHTGLDICKLFASFFGSNFAPKAPSPAPKAPNRDTQSFGSLQANYDIVLKLLLSLDPKKGAGPDGIPNVLLKNCALAHFPQVT